MSVIIGTDSPEPLTGGNDGDIIDGRGGADVIAGLGGDDVLIGGTGDDELSGGDGSDALYGDDGADRLIGGAGWDYAFYTAAPAGVLADLAGLDPGSGWAAGDTFAGIEVLAGSAFADSLRGDAGNNQIYGGGGNDVLFGRDGDDALIGGAGGDQLIGGSGRDWLYGEAGDDAFYAGPASEYLASGSGRNYLNGGDGFDFVFYSDLGRGVYVNLDNELNAFYVDLHTGDLYSEIEGVVGSRFNDVLISRARGSWMYGLDGDDLIDAGGVGPGVHFFGGDGNDTLQGGWGDDWLYGDAGNDIIRMYSGTDYAFGGAGNDRFEVNGDPFTDWYDGGDGDDSFLVWSDGAFGGDRFIGGAGIDTIDLSLFGLGNSTGAVIDLVDWQAATGQMAGASYDGIENISGSRYNDSLRGNSLNNVLNGGDGTDWLYGRGGNDTLMGGAGNDTLFGNDGDDSLRGEGGQDRFFFGAGDGRDRIEDFQNGFDSIQLSTNLGVTNFQDVLSRATQAGADTVITFNAGTTLTLIGVQLSSLAAGDFGFFS